jgi:hypothetical protein
MVLRALGQARAGAPPAPHGVPAQPRLSHRPALGLQGAQNSRGLSLRRACFPQRSMVASRAAAYLGAVRTSFGFGGTAASATCG